MAEKLLQKLLRSSNLRLGAARSPHLLKCRPRFLRCGRLQLDFALNAFEATFLAMTILLPVEQEG